VISLNEVAAQMEPLLRRTLREDINLRVDLDPGLDSVEADPHQLQEVIMNLVLNSCGAMPTGGTLVIATANVTVKEESALATRVSPGKYAVLSVSDDGAGMNAAVLHNEGTRGGHGTRTLGRLWGGQAVARRRRGG
jgi:two-component system cell cycle sensor histidine kinase/response regulator CckA